MKLLFDENLSHHLVEMLEDLSAESRPVRAVGLERATDLDVWKYAAQHGYAIVSKDEDFAERALLEESPPKVIWSRLGNCSTGAVEALLREHREELFELADPHRAPLIALP